MRRAMIAGLVTAIGLWLLPAAGWAQEMASGSIAGVVQDTAGGVMPGVTVEASSPALIEKVRTVVTDDEGRYRIINLRPGVYTVMFSLPTLFSFVTGCPTAFRWAVPTAIPASTPRT